MNIAGRSINLVNSVVVFESSVKWIGMNSRLEAEDLGYECDHLRARLTLWESIEKITEFREAMPKVGETARMRATKHECPFGPAYDCMEYIDCVVLEIGDVVTEQMNVGSMEIELAVLDITALPWMHESQPFNLSSFAVKDVSGETDESKTNIQKGIGWSVFRHGWNRPKISLTLAASASAMGSALRWLAEIRSAPFKLSCNPSMMLADARSEISVVHLAWGNLRRIGNSGLWECDFEFAEAVYVD